MTRALLAALTVGLLATSLQAQEHHTKRWPRPPKAIRSWLERSAKDKEGRPVQPSRTRRVLAGTARTLVDPQFASAIVLADLAKAGVRRDRDRAADAVRNLDTYEFWTGVAVFNASMRAGDAVASRLGRRLPTTGVAGGATRFLKHNLVLAGAMTVSRVVQVDFGGKRLSDLAEGEAPDLSEISITLRPDVDAGEIAITLGAFSVAQPVWSKVRSTLLRFVKLPSNKWLKRTGRVVDLAAILIIAHELEEPAKEAYERWLSTRALRESVDALNALMQRSQGRPDLQAFEAALGDVARSFANQRDFHYLLPAIADAELIQRLQGRGETRENLAALEVVVLEEHGEWLALPGQTLALLQRYGDALAAKKVPGGDVAAFDGLVRRHLARVKPLVRRVLDAKRLPPERLTGDEVLANLARHPELERSVIARWGSVEAYAEATVRKVESGFDATSGAFSPSLNRLELYAQELAYYRLLHLEAKEPEVRTRLLSEAAAIGSLMAVEHELLQKILNYELPAAGVAGAIDREAE